MEYTGYLVTEDHRRAGRTELVCLDEAPEVIHGGEGLKIGSYFFPVQAGCGSLPCPSYVDGWELTCVVCTK